MRSDTPRINVPAVDELEAFSNDFFVSHGVLPFAGAETPPSGEPAAGGDGGGDAGAAAPAAGEGAPASPAAADPAAFSRMEEVLAEVRDRLPAPQQQQQADPTQTQVDAFMAEIFGPEDGSQQQAGAPGQQQAPPPQSQAQEPSAAEAEALIRGIATQGMSEEMRRTAGPIVQRLMALEQSVSERERVRGFQELADEYPELTQEESFGRIRGEATNWASELGNPALVREPGFVELVTLATRAAERGPSEVPPGQQQAGQLESASGARPGTGGEKANRFEEIKKAGTPTGVFG